MRLKKFIKSFFMNFVDSLYIKKCRESEIKKFKDDKRKIIYSKIQLSNEQKKTIDELYKNNYGHKIPYIWHQHYYAFTKRFDTKYFPELLYIPEFEKFMNFNKEYTIALSDKNLLPLIANSVGIKTPRTYISCTYRNV